MPQLDGRVFSRLQQYETLPTDLKDEVSALVEYLTATQNDVFGLHHANLLKTVRSVRAKPLTEKITAWLLQKEAPKNAVVEQQPPAETVVEQEAPAETVAEQKPAETETAAATTDATAEAPAPTADDAAQAKEAAAKAKEEAAAALKAEQEAAAARLAHAKKLLDALVLKGFVTPYKESDKAPTPAPEAFLFKDSELFVPLAAEVAREPTPAPAAGSQEASASTVAEASAAARADDAAETPPPASTTAPAAAAEALPTTVWDLVEGAVFAGALKRKAGFLAPLTAGKDVYAVVNARRKTLTLFDSDVARAPLLEFGFDGTHVAFDKAHFVHGVKVWNDTMTELVNAATKLEREALVHALLAAGLTYHEDLPPGLDKVETIYELKDTDMEGKDVALDTYKGKVLLVVNVSSQCGLTPTNYPELVTLYDKYRAQGLEVLAFPCNQFMGQEPGTHEEIAAFVAQYNATFPFFAKGDVNGVETRPVFAFLKHKLPPTYIQWNFTKFLVDRNGVPVKRFGPMELPLSFESEIVRLLGEEAIVAAVPEAETTTTTTEAATTTTTTTTETETVMEPAAAAPVAAAVEPTPEVAPVEETKAPVPAPVEVEKPVVVETPSVPAPVAAPVEETKVEAAAVPAPAPVETKAAAPEPAPVEAKVALPEPTPEAPVELPTKVEEVVKVQEAAPLATTAVEESTPASKVEPATTASNQSIPVQGFTPGNEPTAP